MGSIEGIVALVIGIVNVLFVPALVWSTVVSGLVHTMRDKIRESLRAGTRRATSGAK